MANSSRQTTGNLPRLLQLGVDKILLHEKDSYKGVGMQLFKEISTDKAYFEAVQLAGVGIASRKDEGSPISVDSVDQNWVYRYPVYTYEKSMRLTMEAIADNLYEDLLPIMARQQAKALAHNKDILMAAVLNNAFATTGPDGKVMCADDHPIQAGGTADNYSVLDLSEDAIEQMVIQADALVNPDGLLASVQTLDLVVPSSLRFEADRIVNSKFRPSTNANDINAINSQNVIRKIVTWKRLSDADAFFLTTDCENGLVIAKRQGVVTKAFNEPTTQDTIVTAYERFNPFYIDWRCVIGSAGAG